MEPLTIDLSSHDLNMTNTCPNKCPVCFHTWMDEVKEKGNCPKCNAPYTMKELDTGDVQVTYSIENMGN